MGVTLVWYAPLTTSLSSVIGKFFSSITYINPSASIWVAFGAGKAFSYFHSTPSSILWGESKSLALPVFHSFTQVFWQGKKLAWETWKCYPDVTEAFTHMALNPYIQLDNGSRYFQICNSALQ